MNALDFEIATNLGVRTLGKPLKYPERDYLIGNSRNSSDCLVELDIRALGLFPH